MEISINVASGKGTLFPNIWQRLGVPATPPLGALSFRCPLVAMDYVLVLVQRAPLVVFLCLIICTQLMSTNLLSVAVIIQRWYGGVESEYRPCRVHSREVTAAALQRSRIKRLSSHLRITIHKYYVA